MDWLKKHVDTVVVLGALISCMLWINGKFNAIDKRFSEIEKECAIMKTVMIMSKIMPVELAKAEDK